VKRAREIVGWLLSWDGFRTVAVIVLVVIAAVQSGVLVAAAVVAILVVLDLALFRPELLRPGVFVLAILAGFIAVAVVGDAKTGPAFYTATAQIIPIMFLALAVEVRGILRDRARPEELRRAPAVTTLALVLGEYESLRALSDGADKADFGLVVAALVAAGVGLVLQVLMGDPDEGD